jgi:hypothetical protein
MCNVRSRYKYTDQTRRGGRPPIILRDPAEAAARLFDTLTGSLEGKKPPNERLAALPAGPSAKWHWPSSDTERTTSQGVPVTEKGR